ALARAAELASEDVTAGVVRAAAVPTRPSLLPIVPPAAVRDESALGVVDPAVAVGAVDVVAAGVTVLDTVDGVRLPLAGRVPSTRGVGSRPARAGPPPVDLGIQPTGVAR